jgi:hypothetical protein
MRTRTAKAAVSKIIRNLAAPIEKHPVPVSPVEAATVSIEAIRVLAYQKWEFAGKPDSDGVPYWLEAEAELLHHTS